MTNVKSITPNDPANFTPEMGNYKTLQPFRYWCQKVLPLVYDDSLSYYELLCKVVDYLNKTMEDVETLHGDVTNLHTAYEELQSYVNNYLSTLDVQEEINNKLDNMASSGELYEIIRRYTDPIVNEQNKQINVLKARMDTFATLPDGSTAGDAELTDIRVGYNGIVYTSAGEAVRAQVGELKGDIGELKSDNAISANQINASKLIPIELETSNKSNTYAYYAGSATATRASDKGTGCITVKIPTTDEAKYIRFPMFFTDTSEPNVFMIKNTDGFGNGTKLNGFNYQNMTSGDYKFIIVEGDYVLIDITGLLEYSPNALYITYNTREKLKAYKVTEYDSKILEWLNVTAENIPDDEKSSFGMDFSIYKNSFIKDCKLTCNNVSDFRAYYNGIDLGDGNKAHKVICKAKFQKGNAPTNALICLIAQPNGRKRISHITNGCIHACFLSTTWHLDVWENGTMSTIQEGTYTTPCEDDIEYEFGFEVTSDTNVRVYLPDGNTVDVPYTDYSTLNGRYVIYEQFSNLYGESQRFPEFTYVSASKNSEQSPSFYDDFHRANGSPMTSPLGYTWSQYNGADGTSYSQ